MRWLPGCVAAVAVASAAACTPAGETDAVSLAGKWEGTITCYQIESPLQMSIDAATPDKAVVSMGDGGALAWDAAVTFDQASRAVKVDSGIATADAAVIAGALSADGDSISGSMDKQLCSTFTLARQP